MIIIQDKTTQKYVEIARNSGISDTGSYVFKLTDRGTNISYTFSVSDYSVKPGFYSISVNNTAFLASTPDGEYEYKLIGYENNVLVVFATGIIRINLLETNTLYYDKNNEYVIYNGQETN